MRSEFENNADASSRPRGRPKKFDMEVVLGKALELFWKRGYSGTTTRDLESELGMRQSSIYNTFGSKSRLLEAALDRYEAMTDETLLTPLENSEQGLEAIETFFGALYEWVTHEGKRGCMLINMMAEDGGKTDSINQRTHRYRARVRSAFRNALEQAQRSSGSEHRQATDAELDSHADLLMGLVLGLNIAARGGLSEKELLPMVSAARELVRSWGNT